MLIILLAATTTFMIKYNYRRAILALLYLFFISLFNIYSPGLSVSYSSAFTMIDMYGSPLVSLTIWIAALIIISRNKIFISNISTKRFLFIILRLNFILILGFSVSRIITFYILFEASLIPTLLLIIGWGYQPERLQARLYLTLYTISARLPLLIILS